MYLNIYVSEDLCNLNIYVSEYLCMWISMYLNIYVCEYLCICVSARQYTTLQHTATRCNTLYIMRHTTHTHPCSCAASGTQSSFMSCTVYLCIWTFMYLGIYISMYPWGNVWLMCCSWYAIIMYVGIVYLCICISGYLYFYLSMYPWGNVWLMCCSWYAIIIYVRIVYLCICISVYLRI